jgi:hypothetical protein
LIISFIHLCNHSHILVIDSFIHSVYSGLADPERSAHLHGVSATSAVDDARGSHCVTALPQVTAAAALWRQDRQPVELLWVCLCMCLCFALVVPCASWVTSCFYVIIVCVCLTYYGLGLDLGLIVDGTLWINLENGHSSIWVFQSMCTPSSFLFFFFRVKKKRFQDLPFVTSLYKSCLVVKLFPISCCLLSFQLCIN